MRIHQQIKTVDVQHNDDVLQQVMDEAVFHINNVVLHQELQLVTTEVGAILHMIIHHQIKPALVQQVDDVLQQPMDEAVLHTLYKVHLALQCHVVRIVELQLVTTEHGTVLHSNIENVTKVVHDAQVELYTMDESVLHILQHQHDADQHVVHTKENQHVTMEVDQVEVHILIQLVMILVCVQQVDDVQQQLYDEVANHSQQAMLQVITVMHI